MLGAVRDHLLKVLASLAAAEKREAKGLKLNFILGSKLLKRLYDVAERLQFLFQLADFTSVALETFNSLVERDTGIERKYAKSRTPKVMPIGSVISQWNKQEKQLIFRLLLADASPGMGNCMYESLVILLPRLLAYALA
jgi:hypothetical protein